MQGCFEIDLICFYLEFFTCLCRGLKVAFSSRYFFLYNIVADKPQFCELVAKRNLPRITNQPLLS